jgi:hypothetical protein
VGSRAAALAASSASSRHPSADRERRPRWGPSARTRSLLLTLACGIAPLSVLAAQSHSTASIARQATPATVTIVTYGSLGDTLGQGSGFLVRGEGVVVTNWHILSRAHRAQVLLASGEVFERVEFLDGDAAADVALLKVPGYGLPALEVSSASPEVGTKVVVIGSPLGLSQTVSEGIVSAVRLVDGKQWIQLTAPISPGSSGGAVLDRSGRVVGIAAAQLPSGQQLNFAVPIRYAMGLLSPTTVARSLADVFGDEEAVGSSGLLAYAEPAASVRRTVTGAYDLLVSLELSDAQRMNLGDLVTDSDGDGWLAVWTDTLDMQRRSSPGFVLPITAHVADASGQVGLSVFSDSPLDGFQTADGFYAAGALGDATMELLAADATWPRSICNGIYDVAVPTEFIVGDPSVLPERVDWAGEAAVITANDSLFLSLTLANEFGGSTGMIVKGPLAADGGFRLTVGDEKEWRSLTGSIVSGRLEAQWIDYRDDGDRFEGWLEGRRR